jgi:putative proteasome-type protease
MTYCVAFLLNTGLVFASDSRTNAGVDYISTYSKMHVFQPSPDRLFVLLAAGNLATTQAVINRIQRDLHNQGAEIQMMAPPQDQVFVNRSASENEAPDRQVLLAQQPLAGPEPIASPAGRHHPDQPEISSTVSPDLLSSRYLFEAADYVGRISVAVQEQFAPALRQTGSSAQASFILGGQIRGDRHGLHLIYPQGNTVMATRETPFLQIGESKYGKPPLDFVGHCGLSLEDAARLCLISQVITRRSNLTVGPPFELALMPADQLKISRRIKLGKGAPEISRSMEVWASCMQEGLRRLPRFAWEEDPL